ncbi:MAG: B12-binding domain-containing radical SAM protein [Chloroflexi bacterium]|nr:B12-binding domain-containing radical SAM protein [Chloroflexota bacterium]
MPYLAARVPTGWDVIHFDEETDAIDWDIQADVVGITFHTPSAPHAYAIADRFRARQVCVALGGPHVTLMPAEASAHADAIFIGEAEGVWEEFLTRFETRSFRRVYQRADVPSLEKIPMARRDLFHRRDGTSGALFATRGCPFQCDFCTVAVMYRRTPRRRPIDQVAAEYASFKGRVIIFWDDNIAGDLQYAKNLFRAIAPYRKWWSSQASIHAGHDEEFLELAARSGCKQLFLGLESISQASMTRARKGFNRVDEYARVIARIHSHGIAVQAGIVFGFDQDTPDIFKDTLDFLEAAGVQNATFNILTPFPGTPLYRQLETEGRILTRDWRKYNSRGDVVYQPKQMRADELLAGLRYANARFYSLPSIAKRLARSPVQIGWTLPLNLAYAFQWWNTTEKFPRGAHEHAPKSERHNERPIFNDLF